LSCVNWTCEGLKLKSADVVGVVVAWCELNLWGIETLVNK